MNILHQNNEIKDERICRNKKYCPLGGECLSPNTVYSGKITTIPPNYKGQSLLWSCRKVVQRSFAHEDYANDKECSKEYWEIKRNNFIPKLTWSLVRECPPYNLSK